MDRVKILMVSLMLGVLYAYISIPVMGIGAAIAIPSSIIAPIANTYPIIALALIDIVTIGLPLMVIYFLLALLVNYFNSNKHYFPFLLLLTPFLLQQFFFLFLVGQSSESINTFATIMPRYILIAAVALYLSISAKNKSKKQLAI